MSVLYLCLLFIGLGLCIFVIAKALLADGLRALVVSPLSLFSVYFGLIHFLTPAVKHLFGFYRYQSGYGESSYLYIGMITLGVYLACWFLLRELQFRFPADVEIGPRVQRLFPVLAFAVLLFLLGAAASYQDYRTLTQSVGMENFLKDRHEAASERSLARILSNFMVIGFSLFVSAAASDRFSLPRIAVLAGMAMVAMYYYGLISSRNSILVLIIFGTMSYILSSRSVRQATLQISKIGGLGIIVASTLCLMYFITLERYSVSETSQAQERLSNAMLYAMDGAFGNDESLLWLWENNFSLQMGETYFAAFTNVVPRSVWPEKPLGGGPVLINMIYPGAYEIGAKGNNSLTTGFLTEAVMNFGFAGALLVVVAWSLLTHFVMFRLAGSTSIYWRNIFLIVWVTLCTSYLHMEFLGYIVRLGMIVAPLLIGALIMPTSAMILEDDEELEDDEVDEDDVDEDDEVDEDDVDEDEFEDDEFDEGYDSGQEEIDQDHDDDSFSEEEDESDEPGLADDEDWIDEFETVKGDHVSSANLDEMEDDLSANKLRPKTDRSDVTGDSP